MELQKDDTRESVLLAAQEIIAQYGYKKTTVDDIARKAGKAKGSIYYHFKSKEEIFQAVIENELHLLYIYDKSKLVNVTEKEIDELVTKQIENT
jgi:AcrR family transcriptional regulator